MAKKRPSVQKRQREYEKRQREIEKAAKAAEKRKRRENRGGSDDSSLEDGSGAQVSDGEDGHASAS